MPLPLLQSSRSKVSTALTRTFFGSHPHRAHVPPKGRESTMATCHPAARHREAAPEAADPVPIATRSNFFIKPSFPKPVYLSICRRYARFIHTAAFYHNWVKWPEGV